MLSTKLKEDFNYETFGIYLNMEILELGGNMPFFFSSIPTYSHLRKDFSVLKSRKMENRHRIFAEPCLIVGIIVIHRYMN